MEQERDDAYSVESISQTSQDTVNIQQEESIPPATDKIQENPLSEMTTIQVKSGGSIYTVMASHDSEYIYTITLFDADELQLQSLDLGWCPEGVEFDDVNLDGYADIVANTGGTWNETHELYIWDTAAQCFTKVTYEGFEMLSFFEVNEGFIEIFLRGSNTESSVTEILIWEGYKLVKKSRGEYGLKWNPNCLSLHNNRRRCFPYLMRVLERLGLRILTRYISLQHRSNTSPQHRQPTRVAVLWCSRVDTASPPC